MNILLKTFSFIGLSFIILFSIALYLDIKEIDKTEGGYKPLYSGFTGETIDWDSMDLSSTGLVKRGYVLNILVNGTTGMISFELLGISFEARNSLRGQLLFINPKKLSFAEVSHQNSEQMYNKQLQSDSANCPAFCSKKSAGLLHS
jgi:hypothetical protein